MRSRKNTTTAKVNLCARVAPSVHLAVRSACIRTHESLQDFVVVAVLERILALERQWLEEGAKPVFPDEASQPE